MIYRDNDKYRIQMPNDFTYPLWGVPVWKTTFLGRKKNGDVVHIPIKRAILQAKGWS
mgnify:CR=1